jgi:hypothetical protein
MVDSLTEIGSFIGLVGELLSEHEVIIQLNIAKNKSIILLKLKYNLESGIISSISQEEISFCIINNYATLNINSDKQKMKIFSMKIA